MKGNAKGRRESRARAATGAQQRLGVDKEDVSKLTSSKGGDASDKLHKLERGAKCDIVEGEC